MASGSVEITGLSQLASFVDHLGMDVNAQAGKAVRQAAQEFRLRLIAAGPGHLGRDWQLRMLTPLSAEVRIDDPDAHRYEFGFIGTDALGRHVEQAPRPFIRPLLPSLRRDFRARIVSAL